MGGEVIEITVEQAKVFLQLMDAARGRCDRQTNRVLLEYMDELEVKIKEKE